MAEIEVALWEESDDVISFTPRLNPQAGVGHLLPGDADYPRAVKGIADTCAERSAQWRRPSISLEETAATELIRRRRTRRQAMA